jgi:hypothetical protein
MAATLNIARDADEARTRRLNEAIEAVRADARGEHIDPATLAGAMAVIDEGCQPLPYDEYEHRLAMFELVAEANRAHRLAFGYQR